MTQIVNAITICATPQKKGTDLFNGQSDYGLAGVCGSTQSARGFAVLDLQTKNVPLARFRLLTNPAIFWRGFVLWRLRKWPAG
ncbi:hypothetical protein, partial [Thalassospira alkalitolerans]|uniref:hypothetical protein n=1 Tax=Thalassospira alkalitolerans TaxID=1293890 RepID=UPI003AA8515A